MRRMKYKKTLINFGEINFEGIPNWDRQNTYLEEDNEYLIVLENKDVSTNLYCVWSTSFYFPKHLLYPHESFYYTIGFPAAPSGSTFENIIGGPIDVIVESPSINKVLLEGMNFTITGSSEGTIIYIYKLG